MKAIHYSKAEKNEVSNNLAKGVTGRIAIGKADGAENFCMRVFELSPEGHTPRHSHEWEHEIFFHSGCGEVYCDGTRTMVENGHVVFIPGDSEHQIRNTGDETLVFVCLVPGFAPEL